MDKKTFDGFVEQARRLVSRSEECTDKRCSTGKGQEAAGYCALHDGYEAEVAIIHAAIGELEALRGQQERVRGLAVRFACSTHDDETGACGKKDEAINDFSNDWTVGYMAEIRCAFASEILAAIGESPLEAERSGE